MKKQNDTKTNNKTKQTIKTNKPTNSNGTEQIGQSTHVRFNDEVRQKLATEKKKTGKTIPKILIDAFLRKPTSKPVFSNEIGLDIRKELNRIGINLNQLARKVNTGLYEGWYSEFDTLSEQLTSALCIIGNHGKGKK